MKLKKNNAKYNLIKLEFIKSKVISDSTTISSYKTNLAQFEIYLKKAISIIYQYHINNKKILFIGAPKKLRSKINKHLFLPESYWVKGLLTNKLTIFNSMKNRLTTASKTKLKQFNKYFSLKKTPDLIVLINTELTTPVLIETTKLKIPVISFNPELCSNNITLYQIPGNYKIISKKENNFLLRLLQSVIKRKIKL